MTEKSLPGSLLTRRQPLASSGMSPRGMQETAAASLYSDMLLQGRSSDVITHRGVLYWLQATRQGKLILTK